MYEYINIIILLILITEKAFSCFTTALCLLVFVACVYYSSVLLLFVVPLVVNLSLDFQTKNRLKM